ncbi:MAG: MBL fold metallo-hydrolase [Candidatus Hodarchaeota archaeon]
MSKIKILFLGGAQEIGRSAVHISGKVTNLLFDSGIKFSNQIEEAIPKFEKIDINALDGVIITHCHLDHVGSLPYLVKLGYKGKILMTAPTKNLCYLMLMDYIIQSKLKLYNKQDIKKTFKKIHILNYGERKKIKNFYIKLLPSAHVLGSCQILTQIKNRRLIYTSDIKLEGSRLFEAPPIVTCDILLVESTYAENKYRHETREESRRKLINHINGTIKNNGVVLIPSFAVGRCQELIMEIDSLIKANQIDDVPILIDGMIRKTNLIHEKYKNYTKIKNFLFNTYNLPSIISRNEIDKISGIIITTSGMLQGLSRKYYSLLSKNSKNCLIFAGFQAKNSFGRKVLDALYYKINTTNRIELYQDKIKVDILTGFSGHSDSNALMEFINKIKPKTVILNHGEEDKINEFKNKLIINKFDASAPKIAEEILV